MMGEQDDAPAGLASGLSKDRQPGELDIRVDRTVEVEVVRIVGGIERDYCPVIVL
jgi:hypothetical protein